MQSLKLQENVPPVEVVKVEEKNQSEFSKSIDRMKTKIKSDPLAIIPVNLACAAIGIKDPLEVISTFEPDREDIGIIISSLVDCVPVVGPLLQGSQFFGKETVTKEQLQKKIDELRKEIIGIIENKIKDSEIEMWKTSIKSHLEGLTESCSLCFEDMEKLKYKLVQKEKVSEAFLDGLRNKLDILRDKVKTVMAFCSNEKFVKYVLPQYLQAVFVYVLLMRNLDAFWYQFGIDEIHVVGRPAVEEKGLKAIPSYREKLHKNICKAIVNMTKDNPENTKGLENMHMLLKSDIMLYPIPLYIHDKEEIPKVVTTLNDVPPMPCITIPDKKCPFIYRIDCVNMQPDPSSEDIRGYRTIPNVEPVTGCKGLCLGYGNRITIKLPNNKYVRTRVFAENSTDTISSSGYGIFGNDGDLKHQEDLGVLSDDTHGEISYAPMESCIHEENIEKKYYVGYFQGEKVKTDTLNIYLSNQDYDGIIGHCYFLEFIVSDD